MKEPVSANMGIDAMLAKSTQNILIMSSHDTLYMSDRQLFSRNLRNVNKNKVEQKPKRRLNFEDTVKS